VSSYHWDEHTIQRKEFTMDARLDLAGNPVGGRLVTYIVSAAKVVSDSTLPAATQELVRLRASQLNGCGFCTDMHSRDAAHAGETSTRLNLVAAWREATVFTAAERAALELTEQGTRIADAAGGVTDEAWANAAKHYDEDQLAPWCPRSPSSTPSPGQTSSSTGPPATTSPASSDDREQRRNSKRGGDTA
jgi:AhpD family alkylhydroperoxidase